MRNLLIQIAFCVAASSQSASAQHTEDAAIGPMTNVAQGEELAHEMRRMQEALADLEKLMNRAKPLLADNQIRNGPGDAMMERAAKMFRRARSLVVAAENNSMEKRRAVQMHDARGLRGEATAADEAVMDPEDIHRRMFQQTTTFPECEEKFLEECLELINNELMELELDAEIVINEKRSLDQENYNKVVIITNMSATTVMGRNNDGIVSYPFMWNDAVHGPKLLNVDGKWDCFGMSTDGCCEIIKASTPNPDVNGNHIECFIFVPFGGVGNPTRSDRVMVNLSPDGRVHEAPIVH